MGLNHRKLLGNKVDKDSCRLACTPSGKLCPPECVRHKSRIFIIVFSSLAVVALLVVCGYLLYVKYFKTRRSSSQPQQPLPGEEMDHNHHLRHDHQEFIDQDRGPVIDHPIWYIRTVGLQESLINSITVCRYKKDDGLVEGTECAVCLSEFQEDETLRLLPKCDHAFHIPCIDTWLASHTNCPMCRAPIIKPTTAALPPSPPEPNVLDSSEPQEEIQLEILESRGEPSSGRVENEVYEVRTEAEEDKQICVNDVVDSEEPRRRSVSMDSPSASKISLALSNVIVVESNGNSNISMGKLSEMIENVPKRTDGNQKLSRETGTSSRGRSLQNGRQTIKKSSSCNGKLLLCMDIQNCDSVFPLRSF